MANVTATIWVGGEELEGDVSSRADVVLAEVQSDSSNKLTMRTLILYIKSSPPKTAPSMMANLSREEERDTLPESDPGRSVSGHIPECHWPSNGYLP
jgi:hypothetical protein